MARSADIIMLWNQLVRDEPHWTTPRIVREVAEQLNTTSTAVLDVIAGKEGAEGCKPADPRPGNPEPYDDSIIASGPGNDWRS